MASIVHVEVTGAAWLPSAARSRPRVARPPPAAPLLPASSRRLGPFRETPAQGAVLAHRRHDGVLSAWRMRGFRKVISRSTTMFMMRNVAEMTSTVPTIAFTSLRRITATP